MKFRSLGITMLLTLFLACTMQAGILTLTGVNGEADGGEYIGPYIVSENGGAGQNMVCADLYTTIGMGQSWDATKLGWGDLAASSQPQYGTAYWLTAAILNTPGPHAADQWALWHLFDPTAPLPGTAAANLLWAQGQYAANPNYAGYQELITWSPNPRSASQEFLTIQAGTETPEPATAVFVGLGLGMLGLSRLKRGKKLV